MHSELIETYIAGPELLRRVVTGMTEDQLNAKPIVDKWSTRQVICHLADFEPIYADRMKRVIVEENPTLFGGDPDVFAAGLAYESRSIENELDLISIVRAQMATILRGLKSADFQRVGTHTEAGKLSLETLLQRITNHVPHHIEFIKAKRAALGC